MTREECVTIVSESYLSTASDAGIAPPSDVDEDTPLVGPQSVLDSMALVTLVLDVEQRLEEQAGVTVTLMSEEALSRRSSPFRNVGCLVDYIVEISVVAG